MPLTAEQAAKRLNRTERTIRRWIAEGTLKGFHPTHGRKDKYLVEESEVDRLAQELAIEQPAEQGPEDQAQDTSSQLQQRVTDLEDQVKALQGTLERIEQALAIRETPESIVATRTPTKRATATTEPITPSDIPVGSILHYQFARVHGVPARTFLDHIQKGHVPDITRQKPNKPGESEHWLTPEQQQLAIAFWTRNGTRYTPCEQCPHEQAQEDSSSLESLDQDTGAYPFKAWLRDRVRQGKRDAVDALAKRLIADTRIPALGSKSLYLAHLKTKGYTEDRATFEQAWLEMKDQGPASELAEQEAQNLSS